MQAGISEEGDASERVFNIGFGTGFAGGRGHVVVGIDYARNEGVAPIDSRTWGRRNPYLVSHGLTRSARRPAPLFPTDLNSSRQTTRGTYTQSTIAVKAFGIVGKNYTVTNRQIMTSNR